MAEISEKIKKVKEFHANIKKLNNGSLEEKKKALKYLISSNNPSLPIILKNALKKADYNIKLEILNAILNMKFLKPLKFSQYLDELLYTLENEYNNAVINEMKILILKAITQIPSPLSKKILKNILNKMELLPRLKIISTIDLKGMSIDINKIIEAKDENILRLWENKKFQLYILKILKRYDINREKKNILELLKKTHFSFIIREIIKIFNKSDPYSLNTVFFNIILSPDTPLKKKNIFLDNIDILKLTKFHKKEIENILENYSDNIKIKVIIALNKSKLFMFKEKIIKIFEKSNNEKLINICSIYLESTDEIIEKDLTNLIEILKKSENKKKLLLSNIITKHTNNKFLDHLKTIYKNTNDPFILIIILKALNIKGEKNNYFFQIAKEINTNIKELEIERFNYLINIYKDTHIIKNALKSPIYELRLNALKTINEKKIYKVIPDIYKSYSNETNEKLKSFMVSIISKLDNNKKWLLERLKEKHHRICSNAIEGLEKFNLNEKELAIIFSMLKHNNNRVKANAALLIWRHGGLYILKFLHRLLKEHKDKWHRASAAYALGETYSIQSISILLECINDPQPEVRRNIALAFGKLGAIEGLKIFINQFKTEPKDVQEKIIDALFLLENKSYAIDMLIDIVNLNLEISDKAFTILINKMTEKELNKLTKLLNHPNPYVVITCLKLLSRSTSEKIAIIINNLIKNLKNEKIKKEAIKTLKRINNNMGLLK